MLIFKIKKIPYVYKTFKLRIRQFYVIAKKIAIIGM